MSWGRAIVPKCPNCGKTSIYPTERATDLRPHSRITHRPQNWSFSMRPRLPSPLSSARDVRSVGNLSTMTESFYERLDIPMSGSNDDIKRAYKQLARKYHPDVSPPDRAEEYTQRFILLQEAYETLSDPQCRALYDRDLARGFHLAFSSRRQFDEELEAKSVWQNRWQHQLEELDRRNAVNNLDENLSWGARMRRRREESSTY